MHTYFKTFGKENLLSVMLEKAEKDQTRVLSKISK